MRPWTAFSVAIPIGMATWFLWAIAADHDEPVFTGLGLVSAAGVSWLLARSAASMAQAPSNDDILQAPGAAAGGWVPEAALLPARIVHGCLAWAWANFLGIDLILFDGDIQASGFVWTAMLVATLAHMVQAIVMRPLAQRFAYRVRQA